jgi:hypothetical protein
MQHRSPQVERDGVALSAPQEFWRPKMSLDIESSNTSATTRIERAGNRNESGAVLVEG